MIRGRASEAMAMGDASDGRVSGLVIFNIGVVRCLILTCHGDEQGVVGPKGSHALSGNHRVNV